jgi:nucleoside-diphosphate-sugar epimerase/predicted dehydrogenase
LGAKMEKINLSLIGCGAAANRYYLPAITNILNQIENIYLIDKDLNQAQQMAKNFKNGIAESDYNRILGKTQGAIVVLPNVLHFPVVMNLMKEKIHVLCEKPLTETGNEVKEMIQTAENENVFLCVNNTRRMFPNVKKIKRMIQGGELGKVKSIRIVEGNTFAWPSNTGFYVNPKASTRGVLQDIGSHILDLVCWWMEGKAENVVYHDDSFGGPESAASVQATMNGAAIDIFLNRLCDLESKYRIVGEKCSIEGTITDWANIKVVSDSGVIKKIRLKCTEKTYPEFVIPIVRNFIEVIQRKEKPLVSGSDVANSIEFIDTCYRNRKRLNDPYYDKIIPESTSSGKVLVTGATGFIGGRIVETLHLSGEMDVRSGIRQWANAARLGRLPEEIVKMDLTNEDEIGRAMDGVDYVIHCAKGPGEINVQGTANLLKIASGKNLKRFVHLSTAEVYGAASGLVDESAPFQYTGNDYNRTKIEAEKICWDYVKKGFPLTIVRPSIVYGPFSNNWTVRFAKLFISGKGMVYEKIGDGKCNLIYIDDLVKAIILMLGNENAVGQAFNINGKDVITWNEYFTKYNDSMGLPPLHRLSCNQAKLMTLAMEPVRAVGKVVKDHFITSAKKLADTFDVAKTLMKGTENALKTTPAASELELYGRDAVYANTKAHEMLKYSPSTSIQEGLNSTVEWLRMNKILG